MDRHATHKPPTWQQLHGENSWQGLLNPINSDLRKHIIRYGELAEAAYDAFNSDCHSKYAGTARYAGRSFFADVGLTKCRRPPWPYTFHASIYATASMQVPESFILKSLSREAWSKESNWMGYVAHTTDSATRRQRSRREIVVAFRGTVQGLEWVEDFSPGKSPVAEIVDDGRVSAEVGAAKVQKGWMSIYTSVDERCPFCHLSAREQVLQELRELIARFSAEAVAGQLSVTLNGHSLGAALATLCAFDVAFNGVNRVAGEVTVPVTAVVFASPKVGNVAFKKVFESVPSLRLLRISNFWDVVPRYPFMGCAHVGVELLVDTSQSPFLKGNGCPRCWHNLEVYLHAVAGYQGEDKEFNLAVDRDVALVNKYLDWLKDEFLVPAAWWVEKNRGMVQSDVDGFWRLSEPPPPQACRRLRLFPCVSLPS